MYVFSLIHPHPLSLTHLAHYIVSRRPLLRKLYVGSLPPPHSFPFPHCSLILYISDEMSLPSGNDAPKLDRVSEVYAPDTFFLPRLAIFFLVLVNCIIMANQIWLFMFIGPFICLCLLPFSFSHLLSNDVLIPM